VIGPGFRAGAFSCARRAPRCAPPPRPAPPTLPTSSARYGHARAISAPTRRGGGHSARMSTPRSRRAGEVCRPLTDRASPLPSGMRSAKPNRAAVSRLIRAIWPRPRASRSDRVSVSVPARARSEANWRANGAHPGGTPASIEVGVKGC
jgi:hypothetical protein